MSEETPEMGLQQGTEEIQSNAFVGFPYIDPEEAARIEALRKEKRRQLKAQSRGDMPAKPRRSLTSTLSPPPQTLANVSSESSKTGINNPPNMQTTGSFLAKSTLAQPTVPPAAPRMQTSIKRKSVFFKDLVPMMYGFGDDPRPLTATVHVVEEMVMDYLLDICREADRIGKIRGKPRVDDFIFSVRKDAKKYARIEELLHMEEVIKQAKEVFSEEAYQAYESDDEDAKKRRVRRKQREDIDTLTEEFAKTVDQMSSEDDMPPSLDPVASTVSMDIATAKDVEDYDM